MVSLTISFDIIDDALVMENVHIIAGICEFAEEIVQHGGCVIVQREYTNASPNILVIFKTVDEVRDWRERMNGLQHKLGRKEIG